MSGRFVFFYCTAGLLGSGLFLASALYDPSGRSTTSWVLALSGLATIGITALAGNYILNGTFKVNLILLLTGISPPTDQQRMQKLLNEFGCTYHLTDDSEESDDPDLKETVIVLQEVPTIAMFMFTKEGKFKEFSSF